MPSGGADIRRWLERSIGTRWRTHSRRKVIRLVLKGEPGGWFEANGTSLSGPLWAAMIADRDSYHGHRSGNINPWVYRLLRTDPKRYFNDITGIGPRQRAATGNGMFPTTPGYDMATGIGTPKMAALITGRW
jgi:kumamolisin